MGIKRTYDIDRQTAITVIINKVGNCTNEQLANMLEEFDESYFRNYMVHDQLPGDTDEFRTIRDLGDFENHFL